MPQMLVRSVRDEAKEIKTFELVDPQYGKLEAFNAGSHIEIEAALYAFFRWVPYFA